MSGEIVIIGGGKTVELYARIAAMNGQRIAIVGHLPMSSPLHELMLRSNNIDHYPLPEPQVETLSYALTDWREPAVTFKPEVIKGSWRSDRETYTLKPQAVAPFKRYSRTVARAKSNRRKNKLASAARRRNR